jgi:hypothetical protein
MVWQASGSFVTWLFCLCMVSVPHQLVLAGTLKEPLRSNYHAFSSASLAIRIQIITAMMSIGS